MHYCALHTRHYDWELIALVYWAKLTLFFIAIRHFGLPITSLLVNIKGQSGRALNLLKSRSGASVASECRRQDDEHSGLTRQTDKEAQMTGGTAEENQRRESSVQLKGL